MNLTKQVSQKHDLTHSVQTKSAKPIIQKNSYFCMLQFILNKKWNIQPYKEN